SVSPILFFFFVLGVTGIISKVLSLGRNYLIRYFRVSPLLSIAGLIEFVFFILGSVWVFKIFEPSYNPADGDLYCNKIAYLFALIYISSIYVLLLGLLIFFCSCLMLIKCIKEKFEHDPEQAKQEETSLPTN
ncbi:hypothetical protein NQ314_001168, partial [Rhamnusium bicolor]